MKRILAAARAGYRSARRAAAYWIRAGARDMPRPIAPSPHDSGPLADDYAGLLGLYPVALLAWLAGRVVRALRRRPPDGSPAHRTGRRHRQIDTLQQLPTLSAAECEAAARQVHELRSHWVFRQPGFFTLGRATYLDCTTLAGAVQYQEKAPPLNEILLSNFEPLYDRVVATLEAALGARCALIEPQAIPGFHIWIDRGIPHRGFNVASVHFDLQYLQLGFQEGDWPRTGDLLSFTLPVRLPREGGALNVWDLLHPEQSGPEVWPFKQPSRVNYSLGSLVLHTGHEMHQIAPIEHVAEGDERICLQGHGIRRDGVWLLYW
ncbi:MAG TPA: hypothetical protein VLV50_19180 [Stellaceae bacterium]|nr:hypothetical protein [Stellaceae bacterium]